jgi:hypothetical protein
MAISRHLIEPHLKTLWWWQRDRVLDVITACLEAVEADDVPKAHELLNTLQGKPRFVAMLAIRDCLRYVKFTSDQIVEALERSPWNPLTPCLTNSNS